MIIIRPQTLGNPLTPISKKMIKAETWILGGYQSPVSTKKKFLMNLQYDKEYKKKDTNITKQKMARVVCAHPFASPEKEQF